MISLESLLAQFAYDPKNPLLFNNGFFVFFFTLFISLYYCFRKKIAIRRYIFCLFSLYFFYKASGFFVGLVIFSAVVDYLLSNAIYKTKQAKARTALLVVSIVVNLGLLFYFKYTDFFLRLSNELFHSEFNLLNLALPVGISFYTFENISYTIDVYRKELVPAKKFSEYLLFLSFFPKLVMGPIVRAKDFVPQINQPYQLTAEGFSTGFFLIITGLFKKLIISDYLTLNYVDRVFASPGSYTGLEDLLAVYGYAVVIYCDFSGYSDVALGIGRWLGFTLPPNFKSPYQSASITEFWQRWHISLSSWLKDYLYIPLGGNRKTSWGTWIFMGIFLASLVGALRLTGGLSWLHTVLISLAVLVLILLPALLKPQSAHRFTGLNLMTTMLLGGFWHGASYNFLIWGALHGLGLSIHKIWQEFTGKRWPMITGSRVYNILSVLLTVHFVCFCWIFFKAENTDTAWLMIQQIGAHLRMDVWGAFVAAYPLIAVFIVLAFLLHAIPDSFTQRIPLRMKAWPMAVYLVLFFGFVLLYGYFKAAEPVMPIYLSF